MPDRADAPLYEAFLSYSSHDRPRVVRIQRFLERALRATGMKNAKIYLDMTDIRGGDLPEELHNALQCSRALIVCCSPAAKSSQWVEREINAFARAKPEAPVLPVLLRGNPGEAVPNVLEQSH